MKTSLTETRIRRVPLQQFVYHREFLKRLYHLGISAREQRESEFTVEFDPFSTQHYRLSKIHMGSVTHVLSPETDSEIPSAITIHNHPVDKTQENYWFDFFSVEDLSGAFRYGAITGLTFVPYDRESLILLLAQLKPSLAPNYRVSFYELATEFTEKIKGRLSPNQNVDLEAIWMQAATESLEHAGAISGAQRYNFPFDCTLKSFLKINSMGDPNVRLGEFGEFSINQKRIKTLMKRLEESEENIRRMENILQAAVNAPKDPLDDLDPEKVDIAHTCAIELEHKIGLPHIGFHIELVKQLFEKGIIKPFFLDITYYLLYPEEVERLLPHELYSARDLSVKLGIEIDAVEEMIASGKLTPDFTLRVDGDSRVEYVFLNVPEINGS